LTTPTAEVDEKNKEKQEEKTKTPTGVEASKPTVNRRRKKRESNEKEERLERVIQVRRVTKVVKGGKRLGFRSAIVVGDKDGSIGVGVGKAAEVPSAIQKGIAKAKKAQIKCTLVGGTIPYKVMGLCGASKVLLRPAPPGTGVIAGGAVRTVLELVGIADVVSKSLGSANPINVAKATINALSRLKEKGAVETLRGTTLSVRVPGEVSGAGVESVSKDSPSKFERIETPLKKKKEKKSQQEGAEEVAAPVADKAPEAVAPEPEAASTAEAETDSAEEKSSEEESEKKTEESTEQKEDTSDEETE